MKSFAELEFIKNISWIKLLTSIIGFLTVYTSIIWALATRTTDSRADYVKMRYSEIEKLETQISQLQSENSVLRSKLPSNEKTSSYASNTTISSVTSEFKEFDNEDVTEIDPYTGIMITVTSLNDKSINLKFLAPDGTSHSGTFYTGSHFDFTINGKNYQFIITQMKNSKAQYLIRELPKK